MEIRRGGAGLGWQGNTHLVSRSDGSCSPRRHLTTLELDLEPRRAHRSMRQRSACLDSAPPPFRHRPNRCPPLPLLLTIEHKGRSRGFREAIGNSLRCDDCWPLPVLTARRRPRRPNALLHSRMRRPPSPPSGAGRSPSAGLAGSPDQAFGRTAWSARRRSPPAFGLAAGPVLEALTRNEDPGGRSAPGPRPPPLAAAALRERPAQLALRIPAVGSWRRLVTIGSPRPGG